MRGRALAVLTMGSAVTFGTSACRSEDNPNCVAPSATWTEVAYLKPPVREVPANFGTTIAMSNDGTTLAVTALSRGFLGSAKISPAGAVLVFQREGARWRYDATLRPTPPNFEVSFGSSLALSSDGRRLVVTAPYDDSASPPEPYPSAGSVFVFDRTASGWKQSTRLSRGKDEEGRRLGVSLALSGDGARIAVGIDEGSDEGSNRFGFVRVLDLESSTGEWKATDVHSPDAAAYQSGEHYGASVALSSDGKTLVVGNWGVVPATLPRTSFVTARGPGNAWAYRLVNGGWQTMQKLESSSPMDDGRFGDVVATSADGRVIAVGASKEATVHMFREADGHWSETHRLSTPSPVWKSFGGPLVLSSDGTRLMVGEASVPTTAVGTAGSLCAPIEGADNGAVYGFDDDGRSFQAFLRPRVHHRDARFGSALAVSSDGRTLAVGAPGEDSAALGVDGDQNDHSLPNAGAVYLLQDGSP